MGLFSFFRSIAKFSKDSLHVENSKKAAVFTRFESQLLEHHGHLVLSEVCNFGEETFRLRINQVWLSS